MKIIQTKIKDLLIIEPQVFEDSRGYFVETYNQSKFEANGLDYTFIQDNQSFSQYGTIRGLHFQTGDYAQAKLVRAVQGKVLDLAVDLRKNSPTLGQYVAVELSDTNFRQLLIPRGFAHGFAVISETAIFAYKCDNLYHKDSEAGILFSDTTLNIDWQIPVEKQIISAKDQTWPSLAEYLAKI
jgi:dTDP-4-dehydrorhamnose 3,5-epimerase